LFVPGGTTDLQAFVDEVRACASGTKLIVPRHFERMAH
jgi:hypothetical protein